MPGHANGHLRFLDRLESTLTDWRTLVRGVQAPPDLVTIVAIDDTIVKHGGTYPLPRAEIAGIVDTIAQFKPKVIAIDLLLVDKGPADGDAALAKSLAARPMVLAAAAMFPETGSQTAETDGEGPLAALADRPSASCCRCRHSPITPKSGSPTWRPARSARRSRCRCCSGPATRSNCRSRFASRRVALGQAADDRAGPPDVR